MATDLYPPSSDCSKLANLFSSVTMMTYDITVPAWSTAKIAKIIEYLENEIKHNKTPFINP